MNSQHPNLNYEFYFLCERVARRVYKRSVIHLIQVKMVHDAIAYVPYALNTWLKIIKENTFANFSQLRKTFPSTDQVGKCTVFNIGGNKVRLIAAIHYNRNIIYIREVLTHADYDTGKWQKDCEK